MVSPIPKPKPTVSNSASSAVNAAKALSGGNIGAAINAVAGKNPPPPRKPEPPSPPPKRPPPPPPKRPLPPPPKRSGSSTSAMVMKKGGKVKARGRK